MLSAGVQRIGPAPGIEDAVRRRRAASIDDLVCVIMLKVQIDRQGELRLHEQVAAAIRHDIIAGEVRPGGRLPPSRDMAAVLGVHPNTVLRALRLLRDEGILEFRRGRSVTVVGDPERRLLSAKAAELLRLAQHWGLCREEVVALIEGQA